MGLINPNSAASGQETGKAKAKVAKDGAKKTAYTKADQERLDVLKWFHPEVKKFFKESLGVDLADLDRKQLYDLKQGKVVKMAVTVTPLAYDEENKHNVKMPPITVRTGVRAVLPQVNKESVAPDGDKHKMFIETYPIRPYMVKSPEGSQEAVQSPAQAAEPGEVIDFTNASRIALQGIGMNREHFFEGNACTLTEQQKQAIASGEVFEVDGYVKTDANIAVHFYDYAQFDPETKTASLIQLDRQEMQERVRQETADMEDFVAGVNVPDLVRGSLAGGVQLDLFNRDKEGNVIGYNEAGENLRDFGYAMMPVEGTRKGKKELFNVSVIKETGSLIAVPFRKVKTKGDDGKVSERLEVMQSKTLLGKKEGRGKNAKEKLLTYTDSYKSEPLEFKTEKDYHDFMAGIGGVVKGAKHTGKDGKEVTYEAYAVPDQSRGGYAALLSPEKTAKVLARKEEKAQRMEKRKALVTFKKKTEKIGGVRM